MLVKLFLRRCVYVNYWIDINTDELDDDALSDGGDAELTPEQQGLNKIALFASLHAEHTQAQMNYALEQVRIVLGNEDVSGFSDNSIKDALWEYYFDVEKTVAWAFGS